MLPILTQLQESKKSIIIFCLLIVSVGLTLIFQQVLEKNALFSHFFYIPVLLSVIWWKKKGTLVAFLLASILILSPSTWHVPENLIDNLVRAASIIVFGVFMAIMSDKVKRSEEELKKTNESYQTVFETTTTATLVSDYDTIILMANTAAEKLFGFSRNDVEGIKSWCDFIGSESLEKMKSFHRRRRQDSDSAPNNYEATVINSIGEPINVMVTAGIIPGTNKSIVSLADITMLRETEILKEKINRVLRLLNDCSGYALRGDDERILSQTICKIILEIGGYFYSWVALTTDDKKMPFITIDHLGEKKLGWSKGGDEKTEYRASICHLLQKTMLSKKPKMINTMDAEPDTTKLCREATRLGYQKIAMFPLVSGSSMVGVLTIYTTIKNEFCREEIELLSQLADNLSYRIISLRARKEQMLAVNNLIENESKLTSIIKAVSDPMLMISKNAEVLWANDFALKTFGNKIIGDKCYTVCCGDKSAWNDCLVKKSFIDGTLKHEEHKHRLPDGQDIDYWCTVSPIALNKDGLTSSALVVLKNVTKLKTLQRESIRNSHLASLGELAAGVAHEINNPINGIINYAQILYDMSSKQDEMRVLSSRIITEGERIAVIVKNLLSFARSREETFTDARLDQIVNDTLALIKAQLLKEGIRLSVDLPDDLPSIRSRPQQLQQVFLNLISNSRYALNQRYPGFHKDKNLKINARCIAHSDTKYLNITVQDHGTGIPADLIERVCHPFFSTKPVGKGTGLGLSISHGIINSHGGRMLFESEVGNYTTVTIELPLKSNG